MPPAGYELDAAITTTYTLDLDALLMVPVALCFNNTLEGDISGERLALLEAISQMKDRVKVFYQKGMIKIPAEYNRLFVLLEPCLEGVSPPGGEFSSFHPKIWLLRFMESRKDGVRNSKLDVRYRLLILSRNLTFDRSWDIAVSLDGELERGKGSTKHDPEWLDFIGSLLKMDQKFSPARILIKELPKVVWRAPPGFSSDVNLLLGGGVYGCPLSLQPDLDELMVISPFIKDARGFSRGLTWLGEHCPNGKKWLFSRSEELNALGEDSLQGWNIFSINDVLVDGEERLEQERSQQQNLHAKVVIGRKGNSVTWHLGSANATSAALGDGGKSGPRNREFMVRLTGAASACGPGLIRQQFIEDGGQGLFVPHKFEELVADDLEPDDRKIRSLIYKLLNVGWRLSTKLDEKGLYTLSLVADEDIPDSTPYRVQAGQLAVKEAWRDIGDASVWTGVNLTQISALVPLRVQETCPDGSILTRETVMLQVSLELPDGAEREKKIFSELINSEEKLMHYIMLLLQSDLQKEDWIESDGAGGIDRGDFFLSSSPLFEQLMKAAAHDEGALFRIDRLLKQIEGTNVPIPGTFWKMWPIFCEVAGIHHG